MNMLEDRMIIPRRCATSEIKLLRLDLFSHTKSVSEDIGCEWTHAQPAETLSPAKAAASLGIEIWSPQSIVKKRYKTLQLRYPPEQFSEKHIDWRPSYELLSSPRKKLNWFWQSGFVPFAESELERTENSIWDKENAEAPIDAQKILRWSIEKK